MKKIVFAIVVLLTNFSLSSAQTVLGSIIETQTLTLANSPYETGYMGAYIPSDAILTIEPGVVITLNSSMSVDGTIVAKGTIADSIKFIGTYEGFLYINRNSKDYDEESGTGCILDYTILEAKLIAEASSPKLSHSRISKPLSFRESNSLIYHNKFVDVMEVDAIGIRGKEDDLVRFTYNEVYHCSGWLSSFYSIIENNYIHDNIDFKIDLGNAIFSKNTIDNSYGDSPFSSFSARIGYASTNYLVMTCNTFTNNNTNLAIECNVLDLNNIYIRKNNFLDYKSYNIKMTDYCTSIPDGKHYTFQIKNNFWNTSLESKIDSSIYDYEDFEYSKIIFSDIDNYTSFIDSDTANCDIPFTPIPKSTNPFEKNPFPHLLSAPIISYPNPSLDGFTIDFEGEIKHITLQNLMGQTEVHYQKQIKTEMKGILYLIITTPENQNYPSRVELFNLSVVGEIPITIGTNKGRKLFTVNAKTSYLIGPRVSQNFPV